MVGVVHYSLTLSELPLPLTGTETLPMLASIDSIVSVRITSTPHGDGNRVEELYSWWTAKSSPNYLYPSRGRKPELPNSAAPIHLERPNYLYPSRGRKPALGRRPSIVVVVSELPLPLTGTET